MRRYVAGLPVDIFQPERNKFRPLLLMIHDLWIGGWCWHDWATHLSNLGWECWAVSLRGRDPAAGIAEGRGQTFDDCIRDLRELHDTITCPVVLLTHGFAASFAFSAFIRPSASAAVLVAPACESRSSGPSRALRLLRIKYLPLMILQQPVLIRASDFTSLWLNDVEEAHRREILQGLVPESPQLVRTLLQRSQSPPLSEKDLPTLTLGGTDDRLVASDTMRALTVEFGGEYRQYPQRGHWMLHEPGWQKLVNDIHRWILNTLGESVLVSDSDES